uniref:Selenoprotein P N-terminal domain-containing protein n=1 Tax=Amphiprion percula TaxID=161767 RepID=A0A3P8S6D3_AMPPE
MYWELKRRAPPGVPVYQQAPLQSDVWEALDGDKDDFLVYDRCGLLTFHIVLPYSFLHFPYVEAAIRATYLKNICNCTSNSTSWSGGNNITRNGTVQFNQTTTAPTEDPDLGDAARKGAHHHKSHHDSHHHPHNHHQHQHPSSQNQPQRQRDASQSKTRQPGHHQHHHSHPQHHHDHHHQHHQHQPANHTDNK